MRMFLIVMLFLSGFCAFGVGGSFMSVAKSAVHEIEGLILIVGGLVAFGAGTVALCVEKMREDISGAVNRGTTVAINEAKLAESRSK